MPDSHSSRTCYHLFFANPPTVDHVTSVSRTDTKPGWITLTTDFGSDDWFVGTMKGVIARISPKARVIDLNHGLPPGDIAAGSFSLAAGFRFFPKGTLHIAIVDPGVGSERHPIAVRTAEFLFLAPDNGILSRVLLHSPALEIRIIANPAWRLPEISHTFHGRDIFAPAAAHLAAGADLSEAGPEITTCVKLPMPQAQARAHSVKGSVVYLDRYGNAITNIPNKGFLGAERAADVFVGDKRVTRVHEFYQSVAPGKPVCVPGSSGFLEIAVHQGDAARKLHLKVGSIVSVKW